MTDRCFGWPDGEPTSWTASAPAAPAPPGGTRIDATWWPEPEVDR